MLILAPLVMVLAAFFCLKHVPDIKWKREAWLTALIFFVVIALCDFFFWIIWRGEPIGEFYKIYFGTYSEVLIVPLVWFITKRSPRLQRMNFTTKYDEVIVPLISVLLFVLTIYLAINYW